MPRYKQYDLNQTKLIPLSYADQVLEGSFEHALNEIVEEHLDLSVFEHRYHNDATGRSAYDPRVLLKIVLFGYYRGIISSRRLAEACRRNVVFMALSADSRPHFTTLAGFVSKLEHEIASLFGDVLFYASELGLIGKEHFAVDGCKLPSNASKKWSGTHKELDEKRKKLERVAERILQRHRERDGQEQKGTDASPEPEKAQRYRKKVAEIKDFLAKNAKKCGPTGNEQKSNLTDPESAKMTSSRGVIQGYNGLALVDDHAQIVVHAEAHGSGYEAYLLAPAIEATRESFADIEPGKDVFAEVKVTADSGFHSKIALAAVEATGADAYIADRDYRRRDPVFAGASRYKQRLRHPDRTPQRQILIIKHPEGPPPRKRENRDAPTKRMRWKFDTPLGREIYSRRMGTIEPVFANIQNKGMRRFTLRGQKKVSAQWKLFTMVHNIEKMAGVALR
jgi:transposase